MQAVTDYPLIRVKCLVKTGQAIRLEKSWSVVYIKSELQWPFVRLQNKRIFVVIFKKLRHGC